MDKTSLTDEAGYAGTDWKYFHSSQPKSWNLLRLVHQGYIGGYSHPNEARWGMSDGHLTFYAEDGRPTVRFDSRSDLQGRLILSGICLDQPNITLCLERHDEAWPRWPATKDHFKAQITNRGWTIGDHTYGLPVFLEEGLASVRIGKYCSFSSGVTIALGNHRLDAVSTYPFATLRRYWPNLPPGLQDHATKGDVVIGNDVWIGVNSFIGSGVTVGDGAVIGAQSVVTHDVPPYAIVAGNPARLIRHRFAPDVISSLLSLQWWDWPDEQVDGALPLMLTDVGAFISRYLPGQ